MIQLGEDQVIKVKTGFLLQTGGILIVLVAMWVTLQGKTDQNTKEVNQLKDQIAAQSKASGELQMQVQKISDNVDWFRQAYEKDMNRYVRDHR